MDAMRAISLEVFKSERGVFMAVPPGCGLSAANRLVVMDNKLDGGEAFAFRDNELVKVAFPMLPRSIVDSIAGVGRVVVGEFDVRGLLDAYFLELEFRMQ